MLGDKEKEEDQEKNAKFEDRFKPFESPIVQKKVLDGFSAIERGEYESYPIPEIMRRLGIKGRTKFE